MRGKHQRQTENIDDTLAFHIYLVYYCGGLGVFIYAWGGCFEMWHALFIENSSRRKWQFHQRWLWVFNYLLILISSMCGIFDGMLAHWSWELASHRSPIFHDNWNINLCDIIISIFRWVEGEFILLLAITLQFQGSFDYVVKIASMGNPCNWKLNIPFIMSICIRNVSTETAFSGQSLLTLWSVCWQFLSLL